jgi:hypothetical protein
MASSTEVSFNLRENQTLSRNILHTCEVVAHENTGQQMGSTAP